MKKLCLGLIALFVISCSNDDVKQSNSPTAQTIGCPAPKNITVTGKTKQTITLSWTNNSESVVIEYGKAGFNKGNGTKLNSTQSLHTITGLQANTHYDIYVRAKCNSTTLSQWTNPVSITTAQ